MKKRHACIPGSPDTLVNRGKQHIALENAECEPDERVVDTRWGRFDTGRLAEEIVLFGRGKQQTYPGCGYSNSGSIFKLVQIRCRGRTKDLVKSRYAALRRSENLRNQSVNLYTRCLSPGPQPLLSGPAASGADRANGANGHRQPWPFGQPALPTIPA